MSPTWLRLVALSRGVPFPAGETLRYFELGFGQGVSLNVHAAANPGEYWGNDYNPEHVAFARQMAEASGANIHLLGDSFEQLAERRDLPQFDVIVAHGIWSWIADGTREAVLRFLDERLAPGGLLYISYNALPGAASGIAVQRLLHAVTASMDSSLSEGERFDLARGYLSNVAEEPGNHFDGYPKARERLDRILGGKSPYLLHEYTVASWRPELLCEVSAQMKQIGLEFCGSAYLDPQRIVTLGAEVNEADLVLEETLRDFRLDRSFRSDLFVRAPLGSARLATVGELNDQVIALTAVPDEVDVSPADPEAQGIADQVRTLLEKLESHTPSRLRIGELLRSGGEATGDRQDLAALCVALNNGFTHPVAASDCAASRTSSERLDDFLCATLFREKQKQLRVSPAIGSAANLSALDEELIAYANQPQELMSRLAIREQGKQKISAVQTLKYAANFACLVKIYQTLALTRFNKI
nr:class I SAM-dependent methyltransferase [Porphyrobacter sp. SLTP]